MQWVECPILGDDGSLLHPPSCSDDEDEDAVVDLLNRREGHCAALLSLAPDNAQEERGTLGASWVLVCGGYTKGIVSAIPLAAPAALLPALQWRELPAVDAFECDGASLTTLNAPVCLPTAANHASETAAGGDPLRRHSGPSAEVAYLFGGFDADTTLRNTLYAVRLHRGGRTEETPLHVVVEEVQTCGDVPAPRARHGAGGCDGRLFIFGGETDAEEQTNTLHVCDVRTGVWRLLGTASPCPAPRLLSVSLVFTSSSTFVLYGGSHFVGGAVESFSDVWAFNCDAEAWTQVNALGASDGDGESKGSLPRSNGHGGGAVLLPDTVAGVTAEAAGSGCVCAVFVGGKDISTGDDDVKVVCCSTPPVTFKHAALPAAGMGKVPHWRYTPAVVTTEQGLLLLAGQCRHAQVPSSFLLTFP